MSAASIDDELAELRREVRTLSEAIRLVSSPLELAPILQAVVDLSTEATDCHACFIYLLEGSELVMRAASPVFGDAVGVVRFPVSEGLAGWVARSRRPQFIRENAMDDPRMRFVPELREDEFQSMAAVPVLARSGETIGVIVLHTQAPREFADGTLEMLVHIGSLVSGAIENAQLYGTERRRTELLAGVAEVAQQVAAARDVAELGVALVAGVARLLDTEICQLLRVDDDGESVELIASVPDDAPAPSIESASALQVAGLEQAGSEIWPDRPVAAVRVTPLEAATRIGMLCTAGDGHPADAEDAEILRALAHLAAVALERAKLIEDLTQANATKDLFDALAAGAAELAARRASELRCDLSRPYVLVCAEPSREQSPRTWPRAAAQLARELESLGQRSAVEVGPASVRAVVSLPPSTARDEPLRAACRELGQTTGAVIGISDRRESPEGSAAAYQEARDAVTIARALLDSGGAIPYAEVGAYRYLVRISADDAPRDRMRSIVDRLIEYDRRRQAALLDTLERYLAERQGVLDAARALYIHPNTLRQRLHRIQELTGLNLDTDDLLSLQLAIKLARLHGRPAG